PCGALVCGAWANTCGAAAVAAAAAPVVRTVRRLESIIAFLPYRCRRHALGPAAHHWTRSFRDLPWAPRHCSTGSQRLEADCSPILFPLSRPLMRTLMPDTTSAASAFGG